MTPPPADQRWIRVGGAPAGGLAAVLPGAAAPVPLADAVDAAAAWTRGPIRLLLETPLCLAAAVPADGLPARAARRARALAYRLEEALPVEAEALRVGAAALPAGGTGGAGGTEGEVLVVAAEREGLDAVLERLSPLGPVRVEPVGLNAALAIARGLPEFTVGSAWLWMPPGAGGVDAEVVTLDLTGEFPRPVGWCRVRDAAELRARVDASSVPLVVVAGTCAAAVEAAATVEAAGRYARRVSGPPAGAPDADPAGVVLAPVDAEPAAAGSPPAWATPAVAALLALTLLLAAAGAGVRGARASSAAAAAQAEQDAVFRAAAPGLPLPASVPAKLRSLAAEAGGGDAATAGASPAARLRRIVATLALPGTPPARLDRLTVDARGATLSGRTGGVADAERVAAAFTAAVPGWSFRVGNTERAAGVVNATWTGGGAPGGRP